MSNTAGDLNRHHQEKTYQVSLGRAYHNAHAYQDALENAAYAFQRTLQAGIYEDFPAALDYNHQDHHGTPAPTYADAAKVIIEAAQKNQASALELLNRMAQAHAYNTINRDEYN